VQQQTNPTSDPKAGKVKMGKILLNGNHICMVRSGRVSPMRRCLQLQMVPGGSGKIKYEGEENDEEDDDDEDD
jgi:hypothetical protein